MGREAGTGDISQAEFLRVESASFEPLQVEPEQHDTMAFTQAMIQNVEINDDFLDEETQRVYIVTSKESARGWTLIRFKDTEMVVSARDETPVKIHRSLRFAQ